MFEFDTSPSFFPCLTLITKGNPLILSKFFCLLLSKFHFLSFPCGQFSHPSFFFSAFVLIYKRVSMTFFVVVVVIFVAVVV